MTMIIALQVEYNQNFHSSHHTHLDFSEHHGEHSQAPEDLLSPPWLQVTQALQGKVAQPPSDIVTCDSVFAGDPAQEVGRV